MYNKRQGRKTKGKPGQDLQMSDLLIYLKFFKLSKKYMSSIFKAKTKILSESTGLTVLKTSYAT